MKRYKKKTTSFCYIILLLIPFISSGQLFLSYEEEINGIDITISELMSQRKRNRAEQDKINSFASGASRWFADYENINAKIKNIQQQISGYGTFQSSELENKLQELTQERNAIYNLRGGTTIQGMSYSSIDDLQSAIKNKGERIIELVNEDEKLTIALQNADIKRDQFVDAYSGNNHEIRQRGLRQKLDRLKKDYKRDMLLVNASSVWCGRTNNNTPIKCFSRKYFIALLTDRYVQKLANTPGKKFDQNEFATLIKRHRDDSNKIKKQMLTRGLNDELAQIKAIKRELKIGIEEADPTGCWVIAIGNGKRPEIEIKENSYGEYDGYITNPGSLDYDRGKKLFTIARINATTFEGTEYSHSNSGQETRIALRIIVKLDRSSADYRTYDDQLMLLPCW